MKNLLIIIVLIPLAGAGQIGGSLGYQSLNFTSNPRAAALAGSSVSLSDGDISQFFENPAILDSVSSGNLFFHFNPYFADAFVYSLAYSFNIKQMDGFAIGVHYFDYGSFEMTDETGQSTGTFTASDYTVSLGKAHRVGPFTLGINVKFVQSSIDVYSSSALVADLGGVFNINKNWTVGMVFENMGVALSSYSDIDSPDIPFDVKVGTSFKPEHMPLRFTLTTNNIVRQNTELTSESTGRSTSQIDKVLKRVNIGTELLLSPNFQLLFGYHHKRKQELRLEESGEGAGFSYGLMVRVKKIQLRFSRATYHAAGGSSFISLQTNLKDFKKIL